MATEIVQTTSSNYVPPQVGEGDKRTATQSPRYAAQPAAPKAPEAKVEVKAPVPVPAGTPPAAAAGGKAADLPEKPKAPEAATAPKVEAKPPNPALAKIQQGLDAKKEAEDAKLAAKELKRLQELIKTNPLEALKALGGDWDSVAAAKLKASRDPNAAKLTDVEKRIQEIADSVDERLEGFKTEQETAAQSAQEAEFERVSTEMATRIEAQKDKYPNIAAYKDGKRVSEEIIQHFESTGKMLSEEEAAQAVEARWLTNVVELAKSQPESTKKAILEALMPKQEEAPKKFVPLLVGKPSTQAAPSSPNAPKRETANPNQFQPRTVQHIASKPIGGEDFAEWRRQKHSKK